MQEIFLQAFRNIFSLRQHTSLCELFFGVLQLQKFFQMSENSCHYYILLSKKIKIQMLKADKELPTILCTWQFIYCHPKWWQTISLHPIRSCFFIPCLGATDSNLSRSILSHTLRYLHCMGYGLFHMAYYIDL